MGLLSKLFKKKEIVRTVILKVVQYNNQDIEFTSELTSDAFGLTNNLGIDITNGGLAETTFQIFYSDGTSRVDIVNNESDKYSYYLQFLDQGYYY